MPNASQLTVTVDGTSILTLEGTALDANGDGLPGGKKQFNFSTVSVVSVPGTICSSRIVDPGPDLIPRTADDVSQGGNGYNYLLPIRGVKVYVIGMESNFTFTDATGRFTLTNMPVGDVKVVLDGRTATNPPAGYYFPEMVMDTTFSPGITNGVMTIRDANGNVVRDGNGVPIQALAMYLPRVASNVLQTVSGTNNTVITLTSNAAYNLPTNQQQYLTITVPPNSLIGMNGQPMSSGQVGVSVVPAELVSDMLPPGLLQHTFDITVQAPGVATFTKPAQMTFPNVFGTNAPPGTKLNLLSFDHTTGRLVIEGTATVSADGLYVTTDPGTGVTHPGWHGLTPPGVPIDILNWLGGLCPKGCDCAGVVKHASSIVLASSLATTAAADAPVVFIAGTVTSIGVSVYDLITEPSVKNTAYVVDSTLGATGNMLATPGKVGQSKPFYLFFGGYDAARKVLGAKWQQRLTSIGNKAKAFGEWTGVFAVAGNGYELGTKLNDCFHLPVGGPVPPPPASTDAIDAYLDDLAGTTTNITDSLEQLLGQKLFPRLPSDRSVIVGSDGSNIVVNEIDGSPFIDLITGQPFTVPITNLLDDRLLSDANFRTNTLTTLKSGLDQFAAKLSPNDLGFVSYKQELTDLNNAVLQLYSILGKRRPNSPLYYVASDPLTGTVIARGKTSQSGGLSFFGPAESFLNIEIFDPASGGYAIFRSFTPKSGSPLVAASGSGSPELVTFPDGATDSDGDGLSDETEFIIGTDPTKWSTAGDGISDGEKVAQGLDPLSGGGLATGIIASLPLQGVASDITIAGSTSSPGQQTAYIACGSGGLSIVNVSQFQKPIVLGQLTLAGR